ncbi:unnamed protein product [Arctogadus glacialis]
MSSHRFRSPAPNAHAQGGPNFRTRAAPRDTTPMRSPPLMAVGAPLVRGHTGSLSAQRPKRSRPTRREGSRHTRREGSRHTRREGSHLPSGVGSRDPGTGKNQLLQFQEGKWSKTKVVKDPTWTFKHVGGLRLGPRGWPQLGGTYQHIWPLNSIREADHLMPYSTLVASSPEDPRRCSNQSIILLSRKLFYHLPTKKRFCVLESSDGRHAKQNDALSQLIPSRATCCQTAPHLKRGGHIITDSFGGLIQHQMDRNAKRRIHG